MRIVIDTLIAVMLGALLIGTVSHYQTEQYQVDRKQQVHRTILRLHEQAVYHGAVGQAPVSGAGFPLEISPLWFGERGVPTNSMVPGRQPWLDIAPHGDNSEHPPDPIITKPQQAGFWYNPNLGIVRARIAGNFSPAKAIETYNILNGTTLTNLPKRPDPARTSHQPPMLVPAD